MKNVTLKAGNEQDFAVGRRWHDWLTLVNRYQRNAPSALKILPISCACSLIAGRLHRDRCAVKRDIDQLAQVGLVTIETKTLTGHGHMKEIRASAGIFRLEAIVM